MGDLRATLYKFLRYAAYVVAGLLLLLLLTYGSLTLWWRSGQVVISRDVVGEIMARSAQGAEPTPAWPQVLEAYERAKGPVDPYDDAEHPVHTKWPERMAIIEQNAGLIAELRDALDHDHLGILSSSVWLTDEGWVFEDPDTPGEETPVRYSLDLVNPISDAAGKLRRISALLVHDAWRAAEVGDAETATTDLVAAFRLAEQSHVTSFLISDLVSLSIFARAISHTLWITESYPGLFTVAQRNAIRDESLRFMDGQIRAALTDEIALSEDIEQRLFTDDGSGNGHAVVYLPGIEFGDEPGTEGRPWSWRGPIWLPIAPSRKEFRAMTERCYDALRSDMGTPGLAQWKAASFQLGEELESSWLRRQRWSFHRLVSLLSGIGGDLFHRSTVMRQGMIAALAAQNYQQDNGRWPHDLNALVPQYLDSIPIDIYDGAAIRYRIDEEDGAPLIYSVGLNGVDDDGSSEPDPNSSSFLLDELDLVIWPWPAPESDAEQYSADDADDEEGRDN